MHNLTFICLIYSIEFFSFSVSTMKVKTMSRPFIFDELFFHFFVPKCWTKHVPSCGWKVWLYIHPFNTQLSAPDYGSFLSPWLFLPSLNRSFRWIISSRSVIMRGTRYAVYKEQDALRSLPQSVLWFGQISFSFNKKIRMNRLLDLVWAISFCHKSEKQELARSSHPPISSLLAFLVQGRNWWERAWMRFL